MIEVKKLVKKYGQKLAIDGINFSVNSGEILGFLGPNGAGKSTVMNIITGYISSTEGTVTIDGCEILDDPVGAKTKMGYLPEMPPLYVEMTVKKYLEFVFDLKKIKENKQEHIKKICEEVQISDVYDQVIKNLSKGYKQRIGIAQALLGEPPLLILDEPTVGLDPKQIIEIRKLIKNLGKNHTIILSSHILSEIQTICDRVIIINNGKIVADDKTKNLSSNISKSTKFIFSIAGDESEIYNLLSKTEGISKITKLGSSEQNVFEFEIESESEIDIRKSIFNTLSKNNLPIMSLRSAELSLEDIFLKLTSSDTSEILKLNPQKEQKTINEKRGEKK